MIVSQSKMIAGIAASMNLNTMMIVLPKGITISVNVTVPAREPACAVDRSEHGQTHQTAEEMLCSAVMP